MAGLPPQRFRFSSSGLEAGTMVLGSLEPWVLLVQRLPFEDCHPAPNDSDYLIPFFFNCPITVSGTGSYLSTFFHS